MNNLKTLNESEMTNISTQELKVHLSQSLEMTAKHLVYLGLVWKELERRGEDLSELKKGMAIYIPMIAYGKIDAHLVISYAGQKTLLSALSDLPESDQKKLVKNPKVTVVDKLSEEEKVRDLIDLSASEVGQVFSEFGIRPPIEQIKFLEREKLKGEKRRKTKSKSRKVSIDTKSNTLDLSNSSADLDRVIDVISEHYGKDLREFLNSPDKG